MNPEDRLREASKQIGIAIEDFERDFKVSTHGSDNITLSYMMGALEGIADREANNDA